MSLHVLLYIHDNTKNIFYKGDRKSYTNYEIPAFGRQRLEDPESQTIVPSTPKFPITS